MANEMECALYQGNESAMLTDPLLLTINNKSTINNKPLHEPMLISY